MQTLNELRVGRFLGRYELLMPVAQGGMAAVWAARLRGTRGFQRVVAIKTILPSLSDDQRFEQMFLDEAGLAARIRHPNVVQVLDLGEESGLLYQVMEWIDGEALHVFLRELPQDANGLPYPIGTRILIGACDGLHAAHETCDDAGNQVGLVHRDISPQNILVTRDGVPKVVDFGVAKASSLSSSETATGTLKGKPGYMAPEQIRGGAVDRRADVFSLGVLLYIVTTARHPFRGSSDMATLHNIVTGESLVKPSMFIDDYPEPLEQIVMKALSLDPDDRFANAASMARALESAVEGVHLVGDAEVASFMRSLLANKLDDRAAALRKALADADARASLAPNGVDSGPPSLVGFTASGAAGELPSSPSPSAGALGIPIVNTPPGPTSTTGVVTPTALLVASPSITPSSGRPSLPGVSVGALVDPPLSMRVPSGPVTIIAAPPPPKGLGIFLGVLLGLVGIGAAFLVASVLFRAEAQVDTPSSNASSTAASIDQHSASASATIASSTAASATDTAATMPTAGESDSTSQISADSLPTALPATPGYRTRPGKSSGRSKASATSSTATPTAPATTAPPPTTIVPSTVPKIRDPGF